MVRGTTLIIPPKKDHFRLQQVLSRNGGIRIPLLAKLSQNQLGNQKARIFRTGSHQPPALWSFQKKPIFRHRFYILNIPKFNHNRIHLSTGIFPSFLMGPQLKIVPFHKFCIMTEKHLTFSRGHAKVMPILKSDDEDGPVKEIPRDPAVGESRKFSDDAPITSEPER